MIFQRLIWAALAAALLVGSVQSGVQRWQAVPIIQAAEVYEGQKAETPAAPLAAMAHAHAEGAAPAHEHGTAEEWAPTDGAERIFWTWVANVLYAFSMALLVFAVMGVCLWRGTAMRSLPLGLLVAAAGWLSFHFLPSLGLHAEIPGMDAARLGSRQGWWVLAAGSAALACVSLAGLRGPSRWAAAAAWLALPFVVGAPHISADPLAGFSGEAQAQLRELGTQFIWATTWLSLSFWVSMGLVCGAAFQRWLRPVMAATFERARPLASAGKAVNP
ncbi:CbtA family protein [Polaromonas sp. CG_9.11]|uniref:CbtA family protein n=1 Tax=Polaromonas sp. CG_9.11 TaxID=2787730 RepID=UPI0018CA649C|nr:CbtA family protein [Polaromonas sp. CG_9.11]MBG6074995.1 cobalt transporter subunit CbtA [Polaromonas sp. CG_9.11]